MPRGEGEAVLWEASFGERRLSLDDSEGTSGGGGGGGGAGTNRERRGEQPLDRLDSSGERTATRHTSLPSARRPGRTRGPRCAPTPRRSIPSAATSWAGSWRKRGHIPQSVFQHGSCGHRPRRRVLPLLPRESGAASRVRRGFGTVLARRGGLAAAGVQGDTVRRRRTPSRARPGAHTGWPRPSEWPSPRLRRAAASSTASAAD